MRRLLCICLLALLFAAPAAAAEQEALGPDSELAGWLWPAAFGFYGAQAAVNLPLSYIIDTPRVVSASLARRDGDTISDLVADLQGPYLTAKDPIAAELRRRTGQDFGYADSASWIKRRGAILKWSSWARKNR